MPWVTIALISSCVVAFLGSVAGPTSAASVFGFRVAPSGLYTWFTSMFLHANLVHLVGNMFFLWLIGSVVEDALGHLSYIAVYVTGGLASAILHSTMIALFARPYLNVPMVGASGALAAVMGVFAVRFYRTKVKFAYFILIVFFPVYGTVSLPSAVAIGLWFAQQLLSGVLILNGAVSQVAAWAHVGGLLAGVAIALGNGHAKRAAIDYLAEDASRWDPEVVGTLTADKYAELAAREPDNPEWHLQWARSAAHAHPRDLETAARELSTGVALRLHRQETELALDAYEHLGASIPTDGFDVALLMALGSRAEGAKRWRLASTVYRDVLEREQDSAAAAKARFRLAHVYLQLDLRADAHRIWGEFIAMTPDSEWIAFADPALRSARP